MPNYQLMLCQQSGLVRITMQPAHLSLRPLTSVVLLRPAVHSACSIHQVARSQYAC